MNRLKMLRLARGLSQWALAQSIRISQGRYSMIERGLIEPSVGERERLAQVLEASAGTLFRPAVRARRHIMDERVTGVVAS